MSLLDVVRPHRAAKPAKPLVRPTFVNGHIVTDIPDLLHAEIVDMRPVLHRTYSEDSDATGCGEPATLLGPFSRREAGRRRVIWCGGCWTGPRCGREHCGAPLPEVGPCVMCLSRSLDEDDRIRGAES